MTIIVGYTIGNVPVLIGDTLISRVLKMEEDAPTTKFDTPAKNNVNKFLQEYTWAEVVGMKQKVNIISKNVMVAWSGSEMQARAAIRDIAQWSKVHKNNTDSLSRVIRNIPKEDLLDCSLIGIARGKTHTNICYANVTSYSESPFDNLWASGSGQKDMEVIISQLDKDNIKSSREKKRESYQSSIKTALEISARCFALDFYTSHIVNNFWGGAMEVAAFNGSIATKIGNVLYTFWIYTNEDEKIKHFSIDPLFVKVDYQGRNMIIRVCKRIWNSEKDSFMKNQFYAVRPLMLSPEEQNLTHLSIRTPSMDYRFLCSTVLWLRNNQIVNSFTDVTGWQIGAGPIRFVEEGKLVSVEIHNGYFEEIVMKSMESFYPDYKFIEGSTKVRAFETQDEYNEYINKVVNVE